MTSTIDLDRGVMVGVYGKLGDKSDSIYVYMYLDTPGEYMNELGGKIPVDMAKAAGFDTAKFAKQKARRDKLQAFEREVDSELGGAEAMRVTLIEGHGYKVIQVSDDAAILTDEDDNQFGHIMTKVAALKMYKNLTAEAAAATIDVPATPAKEVSHGRTAS